MGTLHTASFTLMYRLKTPLTGLSCMCALWVWVSCDSHVIFAGDHVVSEGAGDSDGLGPDKTPLLVGIDVVLLVSVCVCVCVCW